MYIFLGSCCVHSFLNKSRSSTMATTSSLNKISIKNLLLTPKQPHISSKSSPVSSIAFNSSISKLPIQRLSNSRPILRIRASTEPERVYKQVAVEEEPKETDVLKKQLVDSFYGTNRGLSATVETRGEIVELITQLEAKNPTPAPTEALTLLNGKWILAYTSFIGLYPLLSRGTLPLAKVEEISQTIDSENFTVQNSVLFSGPLATTSFSTNAKFEVRSPKRVQIKFEEGIIGTPQLTDSIELPENVEFLGQKIDLNPIKGLLNSLQDTASSVAKTISSQPPLKFSFANRNAESWLLTTYLDDELRISRGDGGSVFVLIKEGSSLLLP